MDEARPISARRNSPIGGVEAREDDGVDDDDDDDAEVEGAVSAY